MLRRFEIPATALLCALLWGSAFPLIKLIYGHWAQAGDTLPIRLTFAGIRFIIAALMLAALRGNPLPALRANTWKRLAALTLGMTFFQYLFFYQALSYSSGVLGALITVCGALWWVILSPLTLGSPKPTAKQWLGLALGATGVLCAVWAPGAGAGNPILGASLFLAATLSGAIGAIAMAKLKGSVRAGKATAISLGTGGLMLALCGAPGWKQFAALCDLRTILTTLFLAAVSAIAFSLWNWLVQRHDTNTLAPYRYLIPICGVTESALFVKAETVGIGTLLGGVLVAGSILLTSRRRA